MGGLYAPSVASGPARCYAGGEEVIRLIEARVLGAFVARLREERGWTQRTLAQRLHVTDKAVSKWERGAGYPDISLLPLMADALGVTETELMRGARLPAEDLCLQTFHTTHIRL